MGYCLSLFFVEHWPIVMAVSQSSYWAFYYWSGYLNHYHWMGTWVAQKEYLPLRKIDSFLRDSVQACMNDHDLPTKAPFIYDEYLLEVICEKPLYLDKSCEYPLSGLLTPREISVLKCFLQGKVAKKIALGLRISPKTVEFHLSNIKEKLNCSS